MDFICHIAYAPHLVYCMRGNKSSALGSPWCQPQTCSVPPSVSLKARIWNIRTISMRMVKTQSATPPSNISMLDHWAGCAPALQTNQHPTTSLLAVRIRCCHSPQGLVRLGVRQASTCPMDGLERFPGRGKRWATKMSMELSGQGNCHGSHYTRRRWR